MIVRTADDRVLLIAQPDHARQARGIVEHAVALAASPRRDAILHATGAHDDGWAEEDAAPTVDPLTGGAVDFINVPVRVRQETSRLGVEQLARYPWAAALVAQHRRVVYDRFRDDPEWTAFFDAMTSARRAMLDTSGLSMEELVADYAFVRLGDVISLVFCNGWSDEQRYGEWRIQLAGTRVLVTPDLFGGASVQTAIEARAIPNRRFLSDEDLREALRDAETITLRGEVSGG